MKTNSRPFATLFLLSIFSLAGCLDPGQNRDDEVQSPLDFGPEVSQEELIRAFDEVASHAHEGLPETGQFVYFEETQQVLGSSKVLIGELLQSIDLITPLEKYSRYSGTHTVRTLTEEGWVTDKSDFYFDVDVEQSTTTLRTEEPPISKALSLLSNSMPLGLFKGRTFSPLSEEVKSSFHHLSTQHRSIDSPTKPKDQKNCTEIPRCLINVSEIRFDVVYWTASPEKYSYYFSYSPDIPQYVIFTKDGMMLDHKLESCITRSVDTTSGKVVVAQCETLKDFQFRYP